MPKLFQDDNLFEFSFLDREPIIYVRTKRLGYEWRAYGHGLIHPVYLKSASIFKRDAEIQQYLKK